MNPKVTIVGKTAATLFYHSAELMTKARRVITSGLSGRQENGKARAREVHVEVTNWKMCWPHKIGKPQRANRCRAGCSDGGARRKAMRRVMCRIVGIASEFMARMG